MKSRSYVSLPRQRRDALLDGSEAESRHMDVLLSQVLRQKKQQAMARFWHLNSGGASSPDHSIGGV